MNISEQVMTAHISTDQSGADKRATQKKFGSKLAQANEEKSKSADSPAGMTRQSSSLRARDGHADNIHAGQGRQAPTASHAQDAPNPEPSNLTSSGGVQKRAVVRTDRSTQVISLETSVIPLETTVTPLAARFTREDFENIPVDDVEQDTTVHTVVDGPRVRQNGALEGSYTSWRHYAQDKDYSNRQLRADALFDASNHKSVSVRSNAGDVLAIGMPIYNKEYGDGWEFTPRSSAESPQNKDDTVPHRVFVDANYTMTVFKQNPEKNWEKVGDRVPDYKPNDADMFEIIGNSFNGKKRALYNALKSLVNEAKFQRDADYPALPNKSAKLFDDLKSSGIGLDNKISVEIKDFSSKEYSKYNDANFVYNNKDGRLYVNSHAVTSTPAGLRTSVGGISGAEMNRRILNNGLQVAAQAMVRTGTDMTLPGDPDRSDDLVGRGRGYDFTGQKPNLRMTADHKYEAGPQDFAHGYGNTDAWGGKFKYGAFSTMIANHQLSVRHPDLIPDLQRFDTRTEEQKQFLSQNIAAYRQDYDNLSPADVKAIVDYGRVDGHDSVFEEEQSVIRNGRENISFMQAQNNNPASEPIDDRIDKGLDQRHMVTHDGKYADPPFEYQAHRTNYNNAYGVPQNTNAGILSGHTAGIRSFELDVLETGGADGKSGQKNPVEGADNEVVVVHDLVTNRTNAAYGDSHLTRIEKESTQQFFDNMRHGVLDPSAKAPRLDKAGDVLPQKLTGALDFINTHADDATVVLDARNDSPVGIAKVLADKRAKSPDHNYDDNTAVKIYPFTLKEGYVSLQNRYAARYAPNDPEAVRTALKPLNAVPVLTGTPTNASEKLDKVSSLTAKQLESVVPDSYYGQNFDRDAKQSIADTAHYNLEYALSFLGNTQLSGIQIPGRPTEESLAVTNPPEGTDGAKLKQSFAVSKATLDTIQGIRAGTIALPHLTAPNTDARRKLNETRLGLSDRFADYYVANRTGGDRIDDTKGNIKKYYYNVVTAAPAEGDTYVQRLRNTYGEPDSYNPVAQYKDGPFSFATTDGSIDLRAANLGVLGRGTIPASVRHHPQAVLKEPRGAHQAAPTPETYKIPEWTQEFVNRNAFTSFLANSPFEQASFDLSRREVKGVTEINNYDAYNWINSWRSSSNFSSDAKEMFAHKFSDGGIAIPFSRDTPDKGNSGVTLKAGFYNLSPEYGMTIYGVDKEGHWFYGQPTATDSSARYNFAKWSGSKPTVPHGDQASRDLIRIGTQNLGTTELAEHLRVVPELVR